MDILITNTLSEIEKDSNLLFNAVMLLRLFTGHYYECETTELYKMLKITYCLGFVSIIGGSCISDFISNRVLVQFFFTLQFLCGIIKSMFFENSILKFITSIHKIDYLLGCKTILVSNRMIFILLLLIFSVAVTFILYYLSNYPMIVILYSIPIALSLVLSYLPHIILLDIIYIRMKSLRRLFERKFVKLNLIGKEDVKFKIINIKTCLLIYKTMLDNFSAASKEIQLGLMIIILMCYPQMLIFVYETLLGCSQHDYLNALALVAKINQTLLLLFAPAIISELIRNEYDQILKSLWRQMLFCKDEALLREIRRAYLYMKLRPFKITIWRAIPLNLSMPISYIGVCISHLIVLIQFTNVQKTFN